MAERYIRNGMPERRQVDRRIASTGYFGPERRGGDRRDDAPLPKEKLKGDWLTGLFRLVIVTTLLIVVDRYFFDSFYLLWVKDSLLEIAEHTRNWSDNLWK